MPNDPGLVVEAPVVNPNATVSNAVGIAAAITPLVLYAASQLGAPVTSQDIATISSAITFLVGLFLWVKNRYFANKVTTTSADLHAMKMYRARAV